MIEINITGGNKPLDPMAIGDSEGMASNILQMDSIYLALNENHH